ncbi:alpha/beta hydrolase fold domain-containing protein [Mycobacteroides abscessus]|uniref:alpha/beta hydrolase fold domain-containing protein n=1 Tax=Mycobacteroides abscessus TaxID=36809 RepID=UPI0012FFEAEE|nr:alpha/beta hydrolase fold domain-containing protein [Mycobacteroides abscessus]
MTSTLRVGATSAVASPSIPADSHRADPDTGRRMTGWIAIIAAALAWFTLAAVSISTGADPGFMLEPSQALSLSQSAVQWFRAGMLSDSFGFYFAFLIIGGYLWARLRTQDRARQDMAVLCIAMYAILGIAGAASQFAALGPLLAAHGSTDAAVREGAETSWLTVVYVAQKGLWWFEGPAMAFWASVTATQLRRSGFRSWWLLIAIAASYGLYFITAGIGVQPLANLLETSAVLTVPAWLLFFGIELLRNAQHDKTPPISLRARIFRWLTRKIVRPIITSDTEPAVRRAQLNKAARRSLGAVPRGTQVIHEELGGVPVEWVQPPNITTDCCIIYFHGGGYLVGSPLTHRNLTTHLAKASGTRVAVVDYRHAPEHPFPAAPTDAVAVYKAILQQGIPAQRIFLAGDSAGAGLALACAIQASAEGLAMPAGLVCLSPWSDLSMSGDSVHTNAPTDAMLSVKSLTDAAQYYLAGQSTRDPLASPRFADLRGLPPMLIQVADNEILYSDAVDLAAAATASGVQVQLQVSHNLWHVWQSAAGQVPESDDAISRIASFIASCATTAQTQIA